MTIGGGIMFYPVCPSFHPSPQKFCIINPFQSFLRNQSQTLQNCCRHIEDVHLPFFKKEYLFLQNHGLFKLRLLWFWLIPDDKLVQSAPTQFLAINLKLCVFVADTLKICACLFKEKNIIFLTILQPFQT